MKLPVGDIKDLIASLKSCCPIEEPAGHECKDESEILFPGDHGSLTPPVRRPVRLSGRSMSRSQFESLRA